MIFGENYGQLAASGEYEVYKSGTTIAQLNAAIAGLSEEEFFDSFLSVAIEDNYSENAMWYPYGKNTARSYMRIYPHTSISQTVIGVNEVCYWYNNDITKVAKTQNVSTMKIEKTTTSVSAGTITLNSWTLYRRQKSYDVAISGSKAAQAIAPVQDSLATANRNYAVGEQFYYDGHLYKVISAITSGAQIVLGTNAELTDDITTQIKNKGKMREVARSTSSSSVTNSAKLDSLYNAYYNLTSEEKLRSYIQYGSALFSSGGNGNTIGTYYMNEVTNSGVVRSRVMRLMSSSSIYRMLGVDSSNGVANADYSQEMSSGTMVLCVRE